MAKQATSAEVQKLTAALSEHERWPGMSVADHERIGHYIRRMADTLGLREWWFLLSHEPLDSEDDALAHIDPTEGANRAVIRLCRDFLDQELDQRRHTVIHELLHCHHHHATDIIRLTLPKLLGQPTYDAVWEPFRLQIEVMVDSLAFVVASLVDDAADLGLLCRGGKLPEGQR